MNATIADRPASVSSRAASAVRRTFSARSSRLNPRSRFSPRAQVSPSSTKAYVPCACSARSSSRAMVDLPEPDRPVSQHCDSALAQASRPLDRRHARGFGDDHAAAVPVDAPARRRRARRSCRPPTVALSVGVDQDEAAGGADPRVGVDEQRLRSDDREPSDVVLRQRRCGTAAEGVHVDDVGAASRRSPARCERCASAGSAGPRQAGCRRATPPSPRVTCGRPARCRGGPAGRRGLTSTSRSSVSVTACGGNAVVPLGRRTPAILTRAVARDGSTISSSPWRTTPDATCPARARKRRRRRG